MAVDFVSVEGLPECLKQQEVLRELPEGHMAKEDKLQVRYYIVAKQLK